MKIYIDPGHGGSDPGAVGNGLVEKNLTLDISLRQRDLFEKLGHIVKMSRTVDKVVSLEARVKDANNWGADLFISNHINAGGGTGIEVWHSISGGKGKEYAARVEGELRKIFKSRGLKTREGRNGDYLFVIRETNMPAILNEFGFIDNAEDATKIKREDIRQKFAEAVVWGILGKEIKSPPTVKEKDRVEDNSSPVMRVIRYTNPMMRGSDVRMVQNKLNDLGYNAGSEDGVYGLKTEVAVKRFQKDNSLSVDGIVGQNTWAKLIKSNIKETSKLSRILMYTSPMMLGEDVRSIQSRLNTLGFNAGSEDGIFGRATEAAIKEFQKSRKLVDDGIVGENTWNSLNE